ncbi:MAG: transglycosylase SLT domain-containing protein [Deltaproteobacteria bacterium]|jgi:soluble lytic murein transglycosylase-like protein|nr:transglycosylase SLT domain-containing protein [Deltaproteobacteria bacterium]
MAKIFTNMTFAESLERVNANVTPIKNKPDHGETSTKKDFENILAGLEKRQKINNAKLKSQSRTVDNGQVSQPQITKRENLTQKLQPNLAETENTLLQRNIPEEDILAEIQNLKKEGLYLRGNHMLGATPNSLPNTPAIVNNLTEKSNLQAYSEAALKEHSAAIRKYLSSLVKEDFKKVNETLNGLGNDATPVNFDELSKKQTVDDKSSEIKKIIRVAGQYHGLDPHLALAVARTESSFRPDVISKDGFESKGLFQLLDSTANDMMKRLKIQKEYQPFDHKMNSYLGVGYLRYLHDIFSSRTKINSKMVTYSANSQADLEKFALAAYNAGEGKVIQAQEKAKAKGLNPGNFEDIRKFLPEITRSYVDKVAAHRKDLAMNG